MSGVRPHRSLPWVDKVRGTLVPCRRAAPVAAPRLALGAKSRVAQAAGVKDSHDRNDLWDK
jgi:hypothetical protein